MNNSSFSDLIFIGLIIYAFYQLLAKGLNKANQPRQRSTPRPNQQNPDLMDFFRSAVNEIKNEAAYQEEETDEPAELTPEEIEMSKQPEEMYTEHMAEPVPIISRQRKKQQAPYKQEYREESGIEPSFEYLKPGELVISNGEKTDTQSVHEKLLDSLCDPHNLQHAILLREVLDPPVSKRK